MTTQVAYCSPFVPAELIAACGLSPCSFSSFSYGANSEQAYEGFCGFCQTYMNALTRQSDLAGVIFATTCDQMRRTYDLFTNASQIPSFLLNVPATTTDTAVELFENELHRLRQTLSQWSGYTPGNDEIAGLLMKSGHVSQAPSPCNGRTRLAVLGSPAGSLVQSLQDAIRQAGGDIVLNATETAIACEPGGMDQNLVKTSPLKALSKAYIRGIPSIHQRPNTAFYDWLKKKADSLKIDKVILLRCLFCDLWNAEKATIQKFLNIPVLMLTPDTSPELSGSTLTRLQAFLEMR